MSSPSPLRLHITPAYKREDKGDGGVRRVVEAQRRYLPALGFDLVDDPRAADIIAAHAGEWVSRELNPPAVRVMHCHGLYWGDYEWPSFAGPRNAQIIDCFRKADLVVSPSEWVARILRRDLWLQTPVLYNGIDLPRGALPENENYVLWNKARTSPVCEIDSLGKLARRAPDVAFVSTFAPEGRPIENLHATGVLPPAEALGVLKKAGVYLATTREVFSVGLLEALGYGVPVLGYRWGGTAEVIRHKVDGWLVEPGDIDGLVGGLEYILTHRDEMSNAARARAKDFTWRAAMERCAGLYREAWERRWTEDRPKVSVVIPCYNLGKYLPDALESVLTQTGVSFEVLPVDDASTDNTREILEDRTWGDKGNAMWVKTTMLPENRYLAEALNMGISIASGKYVLNLDADNMLPPGALARLASALDADEALDVVYGGVRFVEEDGTTPDERIGPGGFPKTPWPPMKFDASGQFEHKNHVQSSAMFRRSVWERVGGYRQHDTLGRNGERVRLNSDAEFWTRAAALGFHFTRIGKPTDATLIYRQRPGSMSRTVPDWDWTAVVPKSPARAPMGVSGEVRTLEPVLVSVLVTGGTDEQLRRTAESLWPQTFYQWEILVDHLVVGLPPYALDGAQTEPRGEMILLLEAGDYLDPRAISVLHGALFAQDERAFAYSNYWIRSKEKAEFASDQRVGALLVPRSAWDARLWTEDWLDILTAAGYCGVSVPMPLVAKDVVPVAGATTEKLMACGCRKKPVNLLKVAGGSNGNVSSENLVLMQYTGGAGSRTFRVGERRYRFGLDRQLVGVLPQDVGQLLLRPELTLAG